MEELERWEDNLGATETALDRRQAQMWTKLPVKVISVDHKTNTVTVQPLVKGRRRMRDDQGQLVWKDESMPVMPMVPIKYPQGGGYTMTFPIKKDDEGTISFSSRCIDNWWAQGGEQPALTENGVGSLRQHSLSDGFFEMGGRSKPKALKNVDPDAVQLRADDHSSYFSFKDGKFVICAPNGVEITKGGLTVEKDVVAGSGTGDSVSLQHHKTSQVMSGSDESGPPVPGS